MKEEHLKMELLIVFAILGLIGVIVAAASLTFVGAAASSGASNGEPTPDSLEAPRSEHHRSTGRAESEGL